MEYVVLIIEFFENSMAPNSVAKRPHSMAPNMYAKSHTKMMDFCGFLILGGRDFTALYPLRSTAMKIEWA